MKKLGFKILEVLGMSLIYLLIGAAFFYGVAWVAQSFALDYLIEHSYVSSEADFWVSVKSWYVLIMMPPIYILIFRALPVDSQDEIKGTALALIYVGDWIAKGALLAFGAYLFYSMLMVQ